MGTSRSERKLDVCRRRPGRPPNAARTAQRRDEILTAAARAFAGAGFHGLDVEALAAHLGVGKGTIYRQFPTKRDLFLAAVDRAVSGMHEAVCAARESVTEPLAKIEAATSAYLAYCDAHPEMVELLILERAVFKDRKKPTYFEHREVSLDRWRQRFRELIRAGRVRNMSPAQITDVISNLLYGTMFTNFFAGRTKSFEQQAREILDVVFNGILSDAEREARERTPLRPPRLRKAK